MRILVFSTLVTFATSIRHNEEKIWTRHEHVGNVGIDLGNNIRPVETATVVSRIIGGVPSAVPYQAGLIITYREGDPTSVCGGALISDVRVLTAGHCWVGTNHQGTRTTVVLGSTFLYYGGTRIESYQVVVHPDWTSSLTNDIAVVYLPTSVQFSSAIAPIALPTGPELYDAFAEEKAIASGFGFTQGGPSGEMMTQNQLLNAVQLSIISNRECTEYFPMHVHDTNICTSGREGTGICGGDSGGPLVVMRNNQPVLVGIASFVSEAGCGSFQPSVYSRVSSFMNFIYQNS